MRFGKMNINRILLQFVFMFSMIYLRMFVVLFAPLRFIPPTTKKHIFISNKMTKSDPTIWYGSTILQSTFYRECRSGTCNVSDTIYVMKNKLTLDSFHAVWRCVDLRQYIFVKKETFPIFLTFSFFESTVSSFNKQSPQKKCQKCHWTALRLYFEIFQISM